MAGAGSQGKGVLAHPQPCFVGLHLRVDIADRGLAMMVTIIDQQPDTQREGGRAQFGARQKAPGDMGRVGSLFEPDARFDTDQSDGEQPDGDRAIEMKGFEVDMTSRADCAATPAIGKERPARLPIDEVGIGLGPDKPAAERRLDGRDQQPVIAPGQAAGDGAAGIGAEPIGKPPLAALRLLQIAADGTAEADHRRGLKQHQQLQPQRVAVGIPGLWFRLPLKSHSPGALSWPRHRLTICSAPMTPPGRTKCREAARPLSALRDRCRHCRTRAARTSKRKAPPRRESPQTCRAVAL